MSKTILKALPELIEAGIISPETAVSIEQFYAKQSGPSSNRLFIVFAILGSLLIGMGIVLIIAHNWDAFPISIKLAFGLLPLLVGQAITGYAVFTGSTNRALREGGAIFLTFSIAVSIAIVSQVYNIEGDFRDFLLSWMLLTAPVIYVLRSAFGSLIYIAGITWYGCEVTYFSYPHDVAVYYWLLLLLIVPFYYIEFIRSGRKNNFFYFHSWLLALSLTICLGTLTQHNEELMFIAYMSLFSLFVSMGESKIFDTGRVISNAWLVIGSLGVMAILLAASFNFFFDEIIRYIHFDRLFTSPEIFAAIVTSIIALVALISLWRYRDLREMNFKSSAFILFIILFFVGIKAPLLAQLAVNIIILLLAINTIMSGARKNHLGILNYGLLIITALIVCRFFDTDISFILRGLLFIGVGAGFFAANLYMIRKRKENA